VKYGRFILFSKRSCHLDRLSHVDVKLFLKQVVAWTGNSKETGDMENKLHETPEPDGALISKRFH